jgi:hypothetical protein
MRKKRVLHEKLRNAWFARERAIAISSVFLLSLSWRHYEH